MRTLFRRDSEHACFVVADLDAAYHEGARGLALVTVADLTAALARG